MTQRLDSELSVKGIVGFAVGLVLVIAASAAAMWGLSSFLRGWEESGDPPPPALPAASEPYLPPEPRLQAEPLAELAELRAREAEILGSFGWVDRNAGIARVPIERAIEMAAAGVRFEPAGSDDSAVDGTQENATADAQEGGS